MSVLDLTVPIMQAPLGGCATPQLVGAVSQAGGLGTLAASWTEPDLLRERIRLITRATDRPFCVNLVLEFEQAERLEVVAEERAPIISFSFGLRPELVLRSDGSRRGARLALQGRQGGVEAGGATPGSYFHPNNEY